MYSKEKINDLRSLYPRNQVSKTDKSEQLQFNRPAVKSIAAVEKENRENLLKNDQEEKVNYVDTYGHFERPETQVTALTRINEEITQPAIVESKVPAIAIAEEFYTNKATSDTYYVPKGDPYTTKDVNLSMRLVENKDAQQQRAPLKNAAYLAIDHKVKKEVPVEEPKKPETVYNQFDQLQTALITERSARMSTAHSFEDKRVVNPRFASFRNDIYSETVKVLGPENVHKLADTQNYDSLYNRINLINNQHIETSAPKYLEQFKQYKAGTTPVAATEQPAQTAPIVEPTPVKPVPNYAADATYDPEAVNKVVNDNTYVTMTNTNMQRHNREESVDGTIAKPWNGAYVSNININAQPRVTDVNEENNKLENLLKELTREIRTPMPAPEVVVQKQVAQPSVSVNHENAETNVQQPQAPQPVRVNDFRSKTLHPVILPANVQIRPENNSQANQNVNDLGSMRPLPQYNSLSAPKAANPDNSNTFVSLKDITPTNNPGATMDNFLPKTSTVQGKQDEQPKVSLFNMMKKPMMKFKTSGDKEQVKNKPVVDDTPLKTSTY